MSSLNLLQAIFSVKKGGSWSCQSDRQTLGWLRQARLMLSILQNLSWPDVVDVLFLTVVAYYLYRWFKGTKALKALIGLVALGALYSLARAWGLFLTTYTFQFLWQVLIILILILFQSEIRQVLERVSPLGVFFRRLAPQTQATLSIVAQAAREAAARRWGAIMVLKGREPLSSLASEGLPVEARLSVELLLSIFNPSAPAHDGAAVIDQDRLVKMCVYLPLSRREDLPRHFGTRHRAGLGITEVTDSASVVVSEERGQISVCHRGRIKTIAEPTRLETELAGYLSPPEKAVESGWDKVRRLFTANWMAKVGSFLLVSLIWLSLAGQQNFEVSLDVPVFYQNLRQGLKVSELSDRDVRVKLVGPRRRASAVRPDEVRVVVSLGGRGPGAHQIGLVSQNIQVPVGLEVTGVSPKVLRVSLVKEESP